MYIFCIYYFMRLKISKKIFAHIDCDSFFASCEQIRNPALMQKYVCVGSEIIVAASYNAKALGIKVGTPIWEARKILRGKDAYFCGVDISYYQKISRQLMQYLERYTLDVRKFSIDEAFVEITGLPEMYGLSEEAFIKRLQKNIYDFLHIPVSIWVANTRLKAKIFSKIHKPFGYCIGGRESYEREIFSELSFHEIPFVGKQTQKKLDFSIRSIEDYINLWYFEILRRFGKNGARIWLELRGVSVMEFEKKALQKSIGRARGFNREMTNSQDILLKKIFHNLEKICDELYEMRAEIRNISLLLIDADWKKYRISSELEYYTSERIVLQKELSSLFFKIYIPGNLYRKTWVFSSDLRSIHHKQLSIFESENTNFEANQWLESVLNELHMLYGEESVRVGC